MRSIQSYCFTSLLIVVLSGCTTPQVPAPQVFFKGKESLNFTGRGSAAAFMLDGLLDGGGMAVGIAIDQGIAKDIAANLNSLPQGFSMQNLVQAQWKKATTDSIKKFPHLNKKILTNTKVVIHTFGFRAAMGESDKVTPWLKLEFVSGENKKLIEYPGETKESLRLGFDQVKSDGIKANALLEAATYQLIQTFLIAFKG